MGRTCTVAGSRIAGLRGLGISVVIAPVGEEACRLALPVVHRRSDLSPTAGRLSPGFSPPAQRRAVEGRPMWRGGHLRGVA